MHIKQIQQYEEIRQKTRAYICYIMGKTINFNQKHEDIDKAFERLGGLFESLSHVECIYALDAKGTQSVGYLTEDKRMEKMKGKGKGSNKSNKPYYVTPFEEKRCTITDPYPSMVNNEMLVTASYPIYNNDELLCIVCVDFTLSNILKVMHPSSVDSVFNFVSRVAYISFTGALSLVSLLLFTKGMLTFFSFMSNLHELDMQAMFKATVLLTLSLAIFDLVKAIFKEEVLGKQIEEGDEDHHLTMIRFLGSIIIALSIESLMLVFKFALTSPDKLLYAIALIGGVSVLLISLGFYMKASSANMIRKQKRANSKMKNKKQ